MLFKFLIKRYRANILVRLAQALSVISCKRRVYELSINNLKYFHILMCELPAIQPSFLKTYT